MRAAAPLVIGASLAIAALALWALWPTDPPEDALAADRETAESSSVAGGLPSSRTREFAEDGVVVPLTSPPVTSVAAVEDVAPVTVATHGTPSEQASFVGRVLDGFGRPLSGATVWHVPPGPVLAQRGFEGFGIAGVPLSEFVAVSTDSTGAFELAGPHMPETPETAEGWFAPRVPVLVITHPDHATAEHVCRGFVSGRYEAGDLPLVEGASVVGRVVDEAGQPLSGVNVNLLSSSSDDQTFIALLSDRVAQSGSLAPTFQVTRTDADGRFRASGARLADGWTHSLVFGRDDLLKARRSLETSELVAGAAHDIGEVLLARASMLTGFVVDEGERPITGAAVVAADWDPIVVDDESHYDTIAEELAAVRRTTAGRRDRTDEHGGFEVPLEGIEALTIYVEAPGFETARVRDIGPDEPPVVVRMVPLATIRLSLVDAASGTPVPGGDVQAWRRTRLRIREDLPRLDVLSGREAREASSTDGGTTGFFLVRGAGPLGTDMVVSAPGYATRGAREKGLKAPASTDRTVRMWPEAQLVGRVTDADEQAIVGAEVILTLRDRTRVTLPPRSEHSTADGSFAFDGLIGGDWAMIVDAPGFLPSEERLLALEDAATRRDVDVVLRRAGRIVATLFDASGAPVTGHELRLHALDPLGGAHVDPMWDEDGKVLVLPGTTMSPSIAITDADGQATFEDLVPGAWVLSAYPGAEQRPIVTAGLTTTTEVSLRRRPVIQGTVRRGALEVAGTSVGVQRWKAESESYVDVAELPEGTSDALGRFRFDLPVPGRFRVLARSAHGGVRAGDPFDVGWGQVQSTELQLGTGRLIGQVTEAIGGEPAAGVQVRLRFDGVSLGPVTTDASGRFELSDLAEGLYEGFVYGGAYIGTSFGPLALSGDEAFSLPLTVQTGAIVTGAVSRPGGAPVPDGTYIWLVRGETTVAGTSADDGTYRLEGVEPGYYNLVVMPLPLDPGQHEYLVQYQAELSLQAGEVRELDLTVEAET